MNRVLVVGGAGYVGSALSEELLNRGYSVRVLDRLLYGPGGLRNIRDAIELVRTDMRIVGPEIVDDVDAVINVGGLSNDPTAEFNPRANYEMNAVAARKLAELCKNQGIRRYILASSCSIYDRGVNNEATDVLMNEDDQVDPKAAYSKSKYDAERFILQMADETFCPTILRKGTIFGFSHRMRYDLVVNTFVKDALQLGAITLHNGGEMWRPLVDIADAVQAYVACLEAKESVVNGLIFNVSHRNMRISELALRVQNVLKQFGIKLEIVPDYENRNVRSYRVSASKIGEELGVRSATSVESSVAKMIEGIQRFGYTDFENPKYYNIRWLMLLDETYKTLQPEGSVLDIPNLLPAPVLSQRSLEPSESIGGD